MVASEHSLKVAKKFFQSWELDNVISAMVEDLAALIDRELQAQHARTLALVRQEFGNITVIMSRPTQRLIEESQND